MLIVAAWGKDMATITGTNGFDVLIGTGDSDDIFGLDGNDTIVGQGGNDTINGGNGNDQLRGEDGDDSLIGGEGDDTLDGGAGIDNVNAGDGDDAITLTSNDTIDGGVGTDRLLVSLLGVTVSAGIVFNHENISFSQLQTIFSSQISNVEIVEFSNLTNLDDVVFLGSTYTRSASINGGAGNDTITGGASGDTLNGAAGDDILAGGDGSDTLRIEDGNGTITVNTATGLATGTERNGSDQIAGFERYDLFGQTINFIGSSASETVQGSGTNVTLEGGAGNDTYILTQAVATIIEAVDGGTLDRVFVSTSFTQPLNVEFLGFVFGANGNFNLTGNVQNNTINGNNGNNILRGEDGDDVITAAGGNDVVLGGNGNDIINGDAGDDILAGGDGNDTLTGGAGANQYIGGIGNDIYIVAAATTAEAVGNTLFEAAGEGLDEVRVTLGVFSLDWFGSSELERLTATDNGNHGALIGNAFGNVITGGTGTDELFGRDGNDILNGGSGAANAMYGQQGDDRYVVGAVGDSVIEFAGEGIDQVEAQVANFTLGANIENLIFTGGATARIGVGNDLANIIRGESGADSLNGLDGDDIITGRSGADILQGGNGADQFRYDGGEAGMDRILDFVSGTDKIALSTAGFTPTATVDFISATGIGTPTSTNATIIYDSSTGIVYYDDDGSGASAAIALAQLNAGQSFAASDFIFYGP
jgi:trimeric autotransporter adhesin